MQRTYISLLQTDNETITDALLQDLLKALEKNALSAAAVQATVANFLSGKYLSCQQVICILTYSNGFLK